MSNAAFTRNGFDDQERNLTFVKTDFQVLKLKFHPCSFKQAFYHLHKPIYCPRPRQQKNTFIQASRSVPSCQTCMCKRGITSNLVWLFFFCPSLDKIKDLSKINKQRCDLARKGRVNAANGFEAFQCNNPCIQTSAFALLATILLCAWSQLSK